MILLIDPPIGPYAPRAELRSWVDQLERMRREHGTDPEALAEVDRHLARARRWLAEAAD